MGTFNSLLPSLGNAEELIYLPMEGSILELCCAVGVDDAMVVVGYHARHACYTHHILQLNLSRLRCLYTPSPVLRYVVAKVM
jgi:hypothetical protein